MTLKKNILICPLDWGLGHATRCVPIIKECVESGANVIIGADNRALAFLKKEFPSLQFIKFPGYEITYPSKGSMNVKMFLSFPRILKKIHEERKLLQKIINEKKIDIVISDNRYGLWNKKVKCVFITHQLTVKCPAWLTIFEYILFKMNKRFINRFDECWIPDIEDSNNLSGDLTNKNNQFRNLYFIGILSRFKAIQPISPVSNFKYNVLFILSGPEPQRTIFENIILNQLKKDINLKALIVRGITETNEYKNVSENIKLVSHMETNDLANVIAEAEVVICRPGYSSIMDLVTLGKKAIFVPTPGQTEQEYLGDYYKKRNLFYSVHQSKFDLLESIEKSKSYNGIEITHDNQILKERIHSMLN